MHVVCLDRRIPFTTTIISLLSILKKLVGPSEAFRDSYVSKIIDISNINRGGRGIFAEYCRYQLVLGRTEISDGARE